MTDTSPNICRPWMRQTAVLAASLLLAATTPTSGRTEDASPWEGNERSAVRLIAGTAIPGEQILRSGVAVRLAPGWKTYWRYPGDAGIPPRFDFSGSKNIKTVAVLWPAPQRFSQDGISLIGYKDAVTFPLHIVPEKAGEPVALRLKLEYGICETICFLAEANVELALSGHATSHEVAIATAEARVPKQVRLGEGATLAIRAVRREVGAGQARFVVEVAAANSYAVDLFAEGPTPDWTLPLPQPVTAPAGFHRFIFDEAVPDPKPSDWTLKLTAVAGEEAIEVTTRVE